MAKYHGDYYIIDRDTRSSPGGKLTTIAFFHNWKDAKAAWSEIKPVLDATFWLARRNRNKPSSVITIAGK